ncbi:hypothetical protein FACS1894216_00130 [Synergistales bacterium]|nr:hypothetical protein FACS1894216_00130 [Synergistales bacterium]
MLFDRPVLKKFKDFVERCFFSEDTPSNIRTLNVVYLLGFAAVTAGIIARIFEEASIPAFGMTLALLPLLWGVFHFANSTGAYSVCNIAFLLFLGDIAYPFIFFTTGGIHSGMSAYFVLSTFLIFLLVKGRMFVILLVTQLAVAVGCYCVSYLHPSLVTGLTEFQILLDNLQAFLITALFIGFVCKFRSIVLLQEHNKVIEASVMFAWEDELLRTVNNMAVELLTSEKAGFVATMRDSLRTMARRVDADRAYIWRNEIQDGKLCYIQVFEWSDGGRTDSLSVQDHTGFSYSETFPFWEEIFAKRQCVNGPVSSLSQAERDRLAPYGIKSILVIPVFLQDKFWGFVSFDDCRKERAFSKTEASILQSGSLLLANALTRNKVAAELDRQYTLLHTVNAVAEIMLQTEAASFDYDVRCCMGMMARGMNMDRMRIWRNHTEDGELYCTEVYEWSGSVEPQEGKKITIGVSYNRNIPGWEKTLSSGQCINSVVKNLSDAEQAQLLPQGIVSFLVVPVFIQERFWGFVALDDCREERVFTDDEESILRSASLLLANAMKRNQNETLFRRRLEQEKLMADISKSLVAEVGMTGLIDNALHWTGEFLGASRMLITILDDEADESKPIYYWCVSHDLIPGTQTGMSAAIVSAFPKIMPPNGVIPTVCCNDIKSDDKYAVWRDIGVNSLIWAPLYIHGKYWGQLSVEDCFGLKVWSESDVQLVSMVSSVIAGAVARNLAEHERAKALEHAISASKAKSQFLSNMSHEMRTPMNAIIGMTAIGRGASDTERKDACFDKIGEASAHLLNVINDVLDMSKIEADKMDLAPVSFDFEKLLQKVTGIVSFQASQKFQELIVSLDENIPRALIGDDNRLLQVFSNLLSNAVKFTPEHGTIRLGARLLSERDDRFCAIRIDVTDTGVGISKEDQERLFTAFEQADGSTSRKHGGTGLGLAIAKRIVELMGGKIRLKSELGKGSTFSFTVELERSEYKSGNRLDRDVNWANARIMAVDDAPDILEYFRKLTEKFGVQCDCAGGGEEALALIDRNDHYDVCFVDWRMPGMDGLELARRIKERCAEKPVVIMISAAEWSIIEEEAEDAGVDKFLAKPLFPSAIAECLSECFGKAALPEKGIYKGIDVYQGRRVLLAEDIEINREVVLALLEPTQLEIDCAENGAEALRMFREDPSRYDMIFMDMQMPEMDGCDATRSIRALDHPRARTIPIIALTANVFKEDVEKCISSGMNDHIGKPVDIEILTDKLRIYLTKI